MVKQQKILINLKEISNYIQCNKIEPSLLLKLILNNIIKDDAFTFIQNQIVLINEDESTEDKLRVIWKLIINKYANHVVLMLDNYLKD